MKYSDIRTEQEFIDIINKTEDVNTLDTYHQPLLYNATEKGFMNAVTLLCSREANVNAYNNIMEWDNVLNAACKSDNIDLIKFLLDRGAKVVETPDNPILMHGSGIISLLYEGHNNMVKFLLEKGWSPNSSSLDGSLADLAIQIQKLEILKLALEKGAKIDGGTLNFALEQGGDDSILTLLFSHQYKNNSIDKEFWSNPQLTDFSKIVTFLNSNNSEEKLKLKNELLNSEKSPLFLEIIFSNPSSSFNLDEIILPLSMQAVTNEDNYDIDLSGLADLFYPEETF